ncbi:MAG: hypothetical protein R3B47_14780 [Bacteroidia bacterium]
MLYFRELRGSRPFSLRQKARACALRSNGPLRWILQATYRSFDHPGFISFYSQATPIDVSGSRAGLAQGLPLPHG